MRAFVASHVSMYYKVDQARVGASEPKSEQKKKGNIRSARDHPALVDDSKPPAAKINPQHTRLLARFMYPPRYCWVSVDQCQHTKRKKCLKKQNRAQRVAVVPTQPRSHHHNLPKIEINAPKSWHRTLSNTHTHTHTPWTTQRTHASQSSCSALATHTATRHKMLRAKQKGMYTYMHIGQQPQPAHPPGSECRAPPPRAGAARPS